MDGSRFDAWSRTLVTAHSRRELARLLAGLALGGTLTLPERAETVAKHKRHKKRRRPALPPPSPLPPPCQGKPDDAPCAGDGKCLNSVCNPPPDCLTDGADCASGVHPCCGSGGSACTHPFGDFYECINRGRIGDPCQREHDCLGGRCVGYRCGYPTCPAGQDACQAPAPCSLSGQCFQPVGGGPTRCGASSGGCGCARDQDCAGYDDGAFCVRVTGPLCTGCEATGTFCAVLR